VAISISGGKIFHQDPCITPSLRSNAKYNSRAEAKRALQLGQENIREHYNLDRRTPYKERQKNTMLHNRHKRQEKPASQVGAKIGDHISQETFQRAFRHHT
jgi:hypothetical protein